MFQLVKLSGAVVSCIGAIAGISIASKGSVSTPSLTTDQSSFLVQATDNSESPRISKEGYYVLADWGNVQWKVKSRNFSKLDEKGNKGLGFGDVEMYIGDKKINRGQKLTTQLNSKKYVLYSIAGVQYKLENGQRLFPGDLRRRWNDLKVDKYDESAFSRWKKSRNVLDYDIDFDTCKFTKTGEQRWNDNGINIRVTCQSGLWDPRKLVSVELTDKDYR